MTREGGFTAISMTVDEIVICKKNADIVQDDIREQEYQSAMGFYHEKTRCSPEIPDELHHPEY
ncbi:MAG TPA: hypothetical protein VHO70_14625 [Chitinispirillaceae bacterium]|nr:hypothetical protein [Chitinispirillaceae bacterium]